MRKIGIEVFGCLVLMTGVISCASKKGFSGGSELCGVVLDEKNRGVADYVVTCSRNGIGTFTAVTGENGMFVFSNMKCGRYEVTGEKIGYGKIVGDEFNFNSRGKILCCKVNSLEGVLMAVENQIKCKNYVVAKKLLQDVSFEKGTPMEATVLFYMGYVDVKLGDYKACESKIKKIKKICNNEFSESVCALEELMYESKMEA